MADFHPRIHSSLDEMSRIKLLEKLWASPRFASIHRPYSPARVAALQLSVPQTYPLLAMATKLLELLQAKKEAREPLHTLGVVDPAQMTQICRNQDAVYVSGWACLSLLTTTNEVSPDFGDYPYNTVPNQVQRLFKAQQFHDRKARFTGSNVDYMKPIVADGDTGHGGVTAVMKLAKLFAENGAAAIHLEDQLHGGKKCGHLGGKVLVPTLTHIQRLVATRLQWDIMGSHNVLIARTDAESANLLLSLVDPRDHKYIKGVIRETEPFVENPLENWYLENKLYTIDEAVKIHLQELGKEELFDDFVKSSKDMSLFQKKKILKQMIGESGFYFDWDAPKSVEGYYQTTGGIDCAVDRALAYAPYVEMLWLETKTPDVAYAREFALKILEKYPDKHLVYNLSPLFNWLAQGFTREDLDLFVFELAKAGFNFQLVSLAGLHANSLSMWQLLGEFKERGMGAYVDLVQQKEKDLECDVFKHQKWSGVDVADEMVELVMGRAGGSLAGSTEDQF